MTFRERLPGEVHTVGAVSDDDGGRRSWGKVGRRDALRRWRRGKHEKKRGCTGFLMGWDRG